MFLKKRRIKSLCLWLGILASAAFFFLSADTKLVHAEHSSHCYCGQISCKKHGESLTYGKSFANACKVVDGKTYYKISGSKYCLKEDFTAEKNIKVSAAKDGILYLCLNGYTLDLGKNYITVADGTLFICDCRGGGVIKSSTASSVINANENGVLQLHNVTVQNVGTGSALSLDKGEVRVYGGTLQAQRYALNHKNNGDYTFYDDVKLDGEEAELKTTLQGGLHFNAYTGGVISVLVADSNIQDGVILATGDKEKFALQNEGYTLSQEGKNVKIVQAKHEYTQLKKDETFHWYECICGCGDVSLEGKQAHNGGNITCTQKAICSVCESEYGDLLAHEYTQKTDEEFHWQACDCGKIKENSQEAHNGGNATCTQKAICSVCESEYGELLAHEYTQKTDEEFHWQACNCGNIKESSQEAHSYGEWSEWIEDGENLTRSCVCECGAVLAETQNKQPSEQPETSDEPTQSEEPETLDEPTQSEGPETSDVPTQSEQPETSDEPTRSEEPETSDEPTQSETTELPETSDEPTQSEEPETSDEPTQSETTELPETTESSSVLEENENSMPTSESGKENSSAAQKTLTTETIVALTGCSVVSVGLFFAIFAGKGKFKI